MKLTAEKSAKIILKDEDVALIIRTDGPHELFIPAPGNDNDLVPNSVLAITLLSHKLHIESVAGVAAQFTHDMAKLLQGKPPGETLQ